MKEKIVVLDDDINIVEILAVYLKNEGYKVFEFTDSISTLEFLEKEKVDMIILDIMMPVLNGFEVCKRIREKYTYPVIMITAKNQSIDKINGLSLGADDYITKPFEPLEVIARVKAQLRRYKTYSGDIDKNEIEYLGIKLNKKRRLVLVNGKEIALTSTEYTILECLMERVGQVVDIEEIFYSIWKDEYFDRKTNTVAVHIRNIRKKIGEFAENREYIETVWGRGYKIG